MNEPDASPKSAESARKPLAEIAAESAVPAEHYDGVELAPRALESLATWDVYGHARREQDRLTAASLPRKTTEGGY